MLWACLKGLILISPARRNRKRLSAATVRCSPRSRSDKDTLLRLPNQRLYIGPHVQEYLPGLHAEWEERLTIIDPRGSKSNTTNHHYLVFKKNARHFSSKTQLQPSERSREMRLWATSLWATSPTVALIIKLALVHSETKRINFGEFQQLPK